MNSFCGSSVVAHARAWIGTPYLHQASCQGAGTDCLGLIRGVWRALYGEEAAFVPPYTRDWSEAARTETLWCAAQTHLLEKPHTAADQVGDVLLFRMKNGAVAKHLGIAAKTGHGASFIHAFCGHAVVESPLSSPWRRRVVARFQFPKE